MARKLPFTVVAFVLMFLFAGCTMPSTNGITQVATIDALLAGVYDGHMSLQALRRFGDFGLGTYESLDGEMLLLDGTFYKVKYDGTVEQPPLSEQTPFAAVTNFVATYEEVIQNPVDMLGLEAKIDEIVPQQNLRRFYRARELQPDADAQRARADRTIPTAGRSDQEPGGV